jgi:hypothetical protein
VVTVAVLLQGTANGAGLPLAVATGGAFEPFDHGWR